MSQKNKEAIIKRDSLENWIKAKKYVPQKNVIIIVDNPDGSFQLKVGDGQTFVNKLPNILQNKQKKEPIIIQNILVL